MPLPWERADRVQIGRLRVRGRSSGAGGRLAISAALDRAELRPSALPPASVLIVRRMEDPMPGQVASRLRPGGPGAAWERAARERLDWLYRRAARPAREAVGADAAAVVFADEAELLAALALDLAAGRAGDRWWWRGLAGSLRPGPHAPGVLLASRAKWVPGALAELARQGRAAELVGALPASDALAVLSAVAAAHGATEIVRALSGPPREPSPPETAAGQQAGILAPNSPEPARFVAVDAALAPVRSRSAAAPPWEQPLSPGSVPARLGRAQAALLGVSLLLQHRPEMAHSRDVAIRLRRWWQAAETNLAAAPPASLQRTSHTLQRAASGADHNPAPAPSVFDRGHAKLPSTASFAATPRPPKPSAHPMEPPTVPVAAIRPAPTVGPDGTALRPHEAGPSPDTAVPPPRPPQEGHEMPEARVPATEARNHTSLGPVGPSDMAEPPGAEVIPPADAASAIFRPSGSAPAAEWRLVLAGGVDTGLGGVLFLINLMCTLDLPECFEGGWRLASTVGAWGVLDGIARGLLGPAVPQDDPIWPALATLSGRGGGRLGAGLTRRASYRVPDVWAAQLPAEDTAPMACASRRNGRLVWSRGGFVLRDEPAAAERVDAFGMLPCRPFGEAPLAVPPADIAPGFRRWLSLVVPFLRRRLERALGQDAAETLESALLARQGRLYVTATHVDLVMGLGQVSLPARLAGLDRSPGWLGQFGRVILFHFE
jgi:hypothetical protein